MSELKLKCSCGEVSGVVHNASASSVNRVVCYCDDCQTFAKHMGLEGILNEQGGTDIIQVPPANFEITSGLNKVGCARLSPKGLLRWHTTCCNTPVGNTMESTKWWSFVGISSIFTVDPDSVVGPARGGIQGRFAINPNTVDSSQKVGFKVGLRTTTWLLKTKLKGLTSCVLFRDGAPISTPVVLSKERREQCKPTHL